MKRLLILTALIFALTFSSNLQAQDYRTGIGFRFGYYNGLTVKHFVSSPGAVEGILTTRDNYFHLTGLYEHHLPFFDVPNMKWYFGIGGYFGAHRDYDPSLGIAGILGMEYSFDAAPLGIGLDWKPVVPIVNGDGFWGDGWAFSIRYTIR